MEYWKIAIYLIFAIGLTLSVIGSALTRAVITGNVQGGTQTDIQLLGAISFFVLLIGISLCLSSYVLNYLGNKGREQK